MCSTTGSHANGSECVGTWCLSELFHSHRSLMLNTGTSMQDKTTSQCSRVRVCTRIERLRRTAGYSAGEGDINRENEKNRT